MNKAHRAKIIAAYNEYKKNIIRKRQAEGIEKEEEFGDLLFSLVNYARWLKINPDDALEKTNKKFKYRFETIEQYAKDNGKIMEEMTLAEMDKIWDLAKGK